MNYILSCLGALTCKEQLGNSNNIIVKVSVFGFRAHAYTLQ